MLSLEQSNQSLREGKKAGIGISRGPLEVQKDQKTSTCIGTVFKEISKNPNAEICSKGRPFGLERPFQLI